MQHLFITDSFEKLVPAHDSTLALMEAALLKKHSVFQCEMHDIFWNQNQIIARGKIVNGKPLHLYLAEKIELNLTKNSTLLVWMRKDPPVNEAYIHTCQMLRLSKSTVLNNPNSLMSCDEKLFALEFPNLIPATYVTQNKQEILNLVEKHGKLVAKPIGGKGGEGIFLLLKEDKNISVLIEMMTNYGKRFIIIQEYLEAIKEGDKRIFLLSGEPLGAVMRVPKGNDHRANMATGGSIEKTTLTAREKEICKIIKPRLLELEMHIVGIDVIGDKLTEINITSPTCLKEISGLDKSDPSMEIIEWAEKK